MDKDGVWEKIKKSLRDGAVMSVEKIEEYTKIGKLKVDEMSAKRKIERGFLDIGERFYDLVQDAREASAADDIVIRKAVDTIRSLYADVAEIHEKIKEVHRAAAAKRGAGSEDSDDSEEIGI
jgi:FtsZ-binding cell division protein ZapB